MATCVACTEPAFVLEPDAARPDTSLMPPPGPTARGWVTQPSWPSQLGHLAPELDLNSRVVRVVPDPERDHFWVLSYAVVEAEAAPSSAETPRVVPPRFALRRYDRTGTPTWSSADSAAFRAEVDDVGAAIGDIAVHDDGSVSVLVLTPIDEYNPTYGAWATLSFMRLDAEGNLQRKVPFSAPLESEQLAWCSVAPDLSWTCRLERAEDQPNTGVWLGYPREKGMGFPLSNQLIPDGDGLIMLRATEGYRLQRLDAEYRAVASSIVLPSSQIVLESAPHMARDTAGHVVVLHAADDWLLSMYAAGGGPKLSLAALTGEDPARDKGVVLQYFDAVTLQRVATHLLAPPPTMLPSALVADGEEVVAVLNFEPRMRDMTRRNKRDVVLLRARVSGAGRTYQRFNVGFGDSATDAVMVDGRVWLSGITNDEDGDAPVLGLVTSVDREGDVGPVLRLSGPRSVQVDAIANAGGGRLLIAGIDDVANLATCSNAAIRCESRAFVGTLPVLAQGARVRAELSALTSTTWRAEH